MCTGQLKRDELVFWNLDSASYFWTPHFAVSTPHFRWTPCLNYIQVYTIDTHAIETGAIDISTPA